jgi:ubiquinone biosynthesis protein COQ9
MRAPPERSEERDAALQAALPHIAMDGWTRRALRAGLRDLGVDGGDAERLFPGGAVDMVETYCDLADRRMTASAESESIAELRLSQRVRALIALRLRQAAGEREAVRRAVAVLALPGHVAASARTAARTADAIWYAAGDRSADISWYTKRAILIGVYGATLLRWLSDTSEDDQDTLAFLDRRLAGVARLGRLRRARAA